MPQRHRRRHLINMVWCGGEKRKKPIIYQSLMLTRNRLSDRTTKKRDDWIDRSEPFDGIAPHVHAALVRARCVRECVMST